MELYQLRHFCAVSETGSFTRAALRVGVSQPALSASVAKLEDEFGLRLLHRAPGLVTPTAAGRRLLSTAQQVLDTCDRAKSEIISTSHATPLKIGVLRTLPTLHLSRLIFALKRAMPGTTIELCDGTQDELQEKLVKRKVAACISVAGSPGSEQQSAELLREGYSLVVGLQHPFARMESIGIAELQDEPLIVRTHCEAFASVMKLLKDHGVKTHVVFKTDQDDRALSLVAAGLGLALMPTLFHASDVRRVRVRELSFERVIELRWNVHSTDNRLERLVAFATSFNWQGAVGAFDLDGASELRGGGRQNDSRWGSEWLRFPE
jgi:DNA-binding transcriptional LysR family regulator